MNFLIKILPVILISIIFYLLFYNLYPGYQRVISSAQKLNELKNKEEEITSFENLIKNLEANANVRQLLQNREVLNSWLPPEPKIEEIIYSLGGVFSFSNLKIDSLNFQTKEVTTTPEILPLGIIAFDLSFKGDEPSLMQILDGIEKNVRLMRVKKIEATKEKNFKIEVESYFMEQR